MVGTISTSKGDISQLFQLDKLLHKDEERLEKKVSVDITSYFISFGESSMEMVKS